MTSHQGCTAHHPGKPCPVVGGDPIAYAFTDHGRCACSPNACMHCHADKRTLAQRLADLQKERTT